MYRMTSPVDRSLRDGQKEGERDRADVRTAPDASARSCRPDRLSEIIKIMIAFSLNEMHAHDNGVAYVECVLPDHDAMIR